MTPKEQKAVISRTNFVVQQSLRRWQNKSYDRTRISMIFMICPDLLHHENLCSIISVIGNL